MQKRIIITLVLLLYLGGATLTFAASNATSQYMCHHNFRSICDARMVRRELAFNLIFALLPPTWLVMVINTGFYQDGFSFTAFPEIKSNGDM